MLKVSKILILLITITIIISGICGFILVKFVLMRSDSTKKNYRYQAPHADAKTKFYHSLESKPWAHVVAKYMEQQKKQEDELMQEFYKLADINTQELQECKNYYHQHYLTSEQEECCCITEQAKKEIKQKDIALIFDFLHKQNIDIPALKVVATAQKGLAATQQSHVYIDDEALLDADKNSLSPLTQAILLHEMQHAMHDDSFNIFIIKLILEKWALHDWTNDDCPEKIKQAKDLLTRFDKFREKRADILAGLVDPMHARVSADCYKRMVDQGLGDVEIGTHPTNATRYAYLDTLHKEMTAPVKSNK